MGTDVPSPTLDQIDLSQNELFRHGFPHDTFSVLRDQAPVFRHPSTAGLEKIGSGEFVIVSRHADVLALSHDTAHYRSFEGPRLTGWEPPTRGQMLITMDPPAHTRMRRLVSAGFTPRMVAALDSKAQEWAVTIVELALEQGTCNFVHEVAFQLPMHMIAEIVGIPVSDRQHVFELVNRQLYALDEGSPSYLPEQERAVLAKQFFAYGRELAAHKRRQPADDVWTLLTTAKVEQPDGSSTRLSELELDLFFIVLAVAGSETTRNAISSGLIALVERPEHLELLRDQPAMMASAVDEIVRWASPVTYFRRTAVQDTILHGVAIKEGDPVTLWYPSANRDEAVFDDPFAFDVTRSANPHVGFGGPGIHFCLGANLARQVIRVLFEELLARVRDIDILGAPVYSVAGIQSPVAYSIKELPVQLTPS